MITGELKSKVDKIWDTMWSGGRQYVAASTSGRVSELTPELRPSVGNNLFVFALPDRD